MECGVHVSWVAIRYVNKYTLKFYLGIKDLFYSSLSNEFLNCQYKKLPQMFLELHHWATCIIEAFK